MRQELIVTGKDISEAVANAQALLLKDCPEAELHYEILETGSKGIFGIIGVKPAKIKAYIVSGEEEESPKRESGSPAKREKNDRQRTDGDKNNRNDRRGRNRRGHNHTNDRAPADFTPSKSASKAAAPKKPVIPEAQLKMEKVEVEPGMDLSMEFINKLIENLGLQVQAELFLCEDGTRRIVLSGEDAGILIGHHGETMDALQYLSNLACTKKNANDERDHSRVTLDIEGYRAKREETLRALARSKAAKALRTGRNVMLEPMSAYERRIIHSEVQGIAGVSTNSIGSDNSRKVVIYLTDEQEVENQVTAEETAITTESDENN